MVSLSLIPAGGTMTDLFDDSPPPCPACNQKQSTPLIFGIPSQEMLVAERLGDIVLASIADDPEVKWVCGNRSCGQRF
jgi:hypothetical protein